MVIRIYLSFPVTHNGLYGWPAGAPGEEAALRRCPAVSLISAGQGRPRGFLPAPQRLPVIRHLSGRGARMPSMKISTYGYPASASVREMPGPGLLRGLSPCNDCGRPGRAVPIPPRGGAKGATPARNTPFLLLRASRVPDSFRKVLTDAMITLDPI